MPPPAHRRDQFRAADFSTPATAAGALNDVLMELYFRIEALERRQNGSDTYIASATSSTTTTGTIIPWTWTFSTDATAVENTFPSYFVFGAPPQGISVVKTVDNTSGATFYEGVTIQNWAWSLATLPPRVTVGFVTGLDVAKSYTLTMAIML